MEVATGTDGNGNSRVVAIVVQATMFGEVGLLAELQVVCRREFWDIWRRLCRVSARIRPAGSSRLEHIADPGRVGSFVLVGLSGHRPAGSAATHILRIGDVREPS